MGQTLANVTYYAGNSFDTNNIPASEAILAANSTTGTLDVINCLPFSGKSSFTITVKAWDRLKDTSYLKMVWADFTLFAIVVGYDYVAMDRVVISCLVDYFLTCGGTAGITDISGLTKRHLCLDDTFGKYCTEDPLLNPRQPLRLVGAESHFTPSARNEKKIVCSTIDLHRLSSQSTAVDYSVDDPTSEGSVVVPTVPGLGEETESGQAASAPTSTQIFMQTGAGVGDVVTTETPNMCYFDGDAESICKGISKARALGVEDAIVGSFIIDDYYVTSGTLLNDAYYDLKGKFITQGLNSSEFNYEYKSNVNNKRVLYGDNNRYVIASIASGNKLECTPEDLFESGDTKPTLICLSDVRMKGKPYFRFGKINGSTDWFINVVEGLEWQNAPLKFEGASGTALQAQLMMSSFKSQAANFEEAYNVDMFKAQAGMGTNVFSKAISGDIQGAVSGLISGGTNVAEKELDWYMQSRQYSRARLQEVAQFAAQSTVVAPQISFPRSESLRDFVGNGIMVYRYKLSDDDIQRIDKILNMYGYADVQSLSLDDLSSGKYFNYLEATDVKIKTNRQVSRQIREGCQEQISSGVRIWKVNPSDSYYSQSNRP